MSLKKILKIPYRLVLKIKKSFDKKRDIEAFKRLLEKSPNGRFSFLSKNVYYIREDATKETNFDAHYIYHPAWAARVLAQTRPAVHIDISSKLYFSTLVSAFIPVEFYDYRPANLKLSNLTSKRADLTALPFKNNSVASISCMHTIEHIGLGRYGDPLDPDGDIKAVNELKRVTAKGGDILFVVPIGKPKLMFNAHRIYSYAQVKKMFAGFELKKFSLIPDDAQTSGMIDMATEIDADKQVYGCGCFWFKK